MRIDNHLIVSRVRGIRPKSIQGVDQPAGTGADSMELSTRAADIRTAMEAITLAPEVRAEHVAELRGQIELGTYDTAIDALAHKLFRQR